MLQKHCPGVHVAVRERGGDGGWREAAAEGEQLTV